MMRHVADGVGGLRVLAEEARITRARSQEGPGGNLCRCRCNSRILDAAEIAARTTM